MNPFENLKIGMGVGGWMTNYKRVRFLPQDKAFDITVGDKEHFENYLTKWDVENIKSFGMDHIRIPFDQVVIEEIDKPYCYREDMLLLLDRVIQWSMDAGLDVVLNLHHAVGCYCDFEEGSNLLEEEALQDRLVALWDMLEDRYHHLNIVFEILNEVTSGDADAWNKLAGRCVQTLRAKNPTRRIILGSVRWNSVKHLKDLYVFEDDPYVGYTYHFYEPHVFTHQRSMGNAKLYYYNRECPYPGPQKIYQEFAEASNGKPEVYDDYPVIDGQYIENYLEDAVAFKKAHPDKFLWLGEFGTIRHAKLEWRENWMRDVIRHAKKNNIPYSVWNYLSTPYDCNRFSLVTDDERRIVSDEMLRIIQGNV